MICVAEAGRCCRWTPSGPPTPRPTRPSPTAARWASATSTTATPKCWSPRPAPGHSASARRRWRSRKPSRCRPATDGNDTPKRRRARRWAPASVERPLGGGGWRLDRLRPGGRVPALPLAQEWPARHRRAALHRVLHYVVAGVLRRLGCLPLLQPGSDTAALGEEPVHHPEQTGVRVGRLRLVLCRRIRRGPGPVPLVPPSVSLSELPCRPGDHGVRSVHPVELRDGGRSFLRDELVPVPGIDRSDHPHR